MKLTKPFKQNGYGQYLFSLLQDLEMGSPES